MSKQFEEIKMYRCKWCGKVFHTTKHDCKFDPDKVNCFTCKYQDGITWEEGSECYFDCDKYDELVDTCATEEYSDLEYIKENNYNTGCPMYEQVAGYEGKKSLRMIYEHPKYTQEVRNEIQDDFLF